MDNFLVSVIIPTYKRSEMLPRAIDSVLNQTYKNIQVVIVDDNNPDTDYRRTTEQRMSAYSEDSRVKYICHNKNRNGSVARNTGIKNADGEIITFLDDDDWYLSQKIEKQVDYLLSHPEFRAVYCGWIRNGKENLPFDEGDLSYNILSGDHIILTNVIMMWKKEAIDCGGWDETFMRHQEAALLLRYFRNGGIIGLVPEALVEYDMSDRSNAAENSRRNEYQTMHFLNSYNDIIQKCDFNAPGSEKKIWLHRYRGMFLSYLRSKDVKGALSFFYRYCSKMPFAFFKSLVEYSVERFRRKKHNDNK